MGGGCEIERTRDQSRGPSVTALAGSEKTLIKRRRRDNQLEKNLVYLQAALGDNCTLAKRRSLTYTQWGRGESNFNGEIFGGRLRTTHPAKKKFDSMES